jgi:hypothetical protein
MHGTTWVWVNLTDGLYMCQLLGGGMRVFQKFGGEGGWGACNYMKRHPALRTIRFPAHDFQLSLSPGVLHVWRPTSAHGRLNRRGTTYNLACARMLSPEGQGAPVEKSEDSDGDGGGTTHGVSTFKLQGEEIDCDLALAIGHLLYLVQPVQVVVAKGLRDYLRESVNENALDQHLCSCLECIPPFSRFASQW